MEPATSTSAQAGGQRADQREKENTADAQDKKVVGSEGSSEGAVVSSLYGQPTTSALEKRDQEKRDHKEDVRARGYEDKRLVPLAFRPPLTSDKEQTMSAQSGALETVTSKDRVFKFTKIHKENTGGAL